MKKVGWRVKHIVVLINLIKLVTEELIAIFAKIVTENAYWFQIQATTKKMLELNANDMVAR